MSLLIIEQFRQHHQLVAHCHIPTPRVSCCLFNEAVRDKKLSHYDCGVIAGLLQHHHQLIEIVASSTTYSNCGTIANLLWHYCHNFTHVESCCLFKEGVRDQNLSHLYCGLITNFFCCGIIANLAIFTLQSKIFHIYCFAMIAIHLHSHGLVQNFTVIL
jgi:hypothetical protein